MSLKLPPPVAAYIKPTNDHDSVAFLASFTEDALVNDIQREFWGKAAIGKWVGSAKKLSMPKAVSKADVEPKAQMEKAPSSAGLR